MEKKQGDDRHRENLTRKTGAKEIKGNMANTLIKGLALTIGGGLVVGLGIKIGQNTTPPFPPQQAVDLGPVLERMEGVENRVVNVETAQAALAALTEPGPMLIPSVHELEERLQAHDSEVEALRAAIQRSTEKSEARIDDLGHAVSDLEAKLPELIDHSIKPKFEELHDRVQHEMEETTSQTLETFADQIQARVVEKITSIVFDLGRQSETINDLRDYSLKTGQNLERLLAGVESLADRINSTFATPTETPRAAPPAPQVAHTVGVGLAPPAREPSSLEARMVIPAAPPSAAPATTLAPKPTNLAPPAPAPATTQAPKPTNPAPPATPAKPDIPSKIDLGETAHVRPPVAFPIPKLESISRSDFDYLLAKPPRSNGLRKAAFASGGIALVALVATGVELSGVLQDPTSAHAASNKQSASFVPSGAGSPDTKKLTDQSELLNQARAFTQNREHGKAEDIYRSILKNDPTNIEVKRLLASALFRQEKIDESVKVLNSIAVAKPTGPANSPQQ